MRRTHWLLTMMQTMHLTPMIENPDLRWSSWWTEDQSPGGATNKTVPHQARLRQSISQPWSPHKNSVGYVSFWQTSPLISLAQQRYSATIKPQFGSSGILNSTSAQNTSTSNIILSVKMKLEVPFASRTFQLQIMLLTSWQRGFLETILVDCICSWAWLNQRSLTTLCHQPHPEWECKTTWYPVE